MVPNGTTNQTIGLAHGWQTLTTGKPYSAPRAAGQHHALHHPAVSDGLNTQDRW